MKKIIALTLLVFMSVLLVSCKNDECNINFYYLYEGSTDVTIKIEKGKTIVFPEEVTREGYVFLGWYNNIYYQEIITDDYIVNQSTGFYARWDEVYSIPNVSTTSSEVKIYTDLIYKTVDDVHLMLDIYYPISSGNELLPVLFAYYGGGWIMGNKETISFLQPIINNVLDAGFVVVVPNYRLCVNGVSYPSPVEDALDAVRYIVKNKELLNIDTNNMGTIGYSAGGHLASMVGFAQNHFNSFDELKDYSFQMKYVVDMYGPAYYDIKEIGLLSSIGKIMLTSYLGSSDYANELYERALPSYYVGENSPKVFITHGLMDSLVPVTQSQMFEKLLKEKNIDVESLYVYGADHTLDPAKGYTSTAPTKLEVYEKISEFIIKQK